MRIHFTYSVSLNEYDLIPLLKQMNWMMSRGSRRRSKWEKKKNNNKLTDLV